jgi:CHRD domain
MRKLGTVVALAVVAAAIFVLAGAALADGDNRGFRASLNGYNEVVGPGSISTIARGTFTAEIDRGDGVIAYRLSYRNLETTATQAHIHFAQERVGGGVIAFLCGGGDKPACPATSGTVRGEIDASDIIGPESQGIEPGSFGEAVRAVRAGAVYVNVHSTRWPAGEIRGQVRRR